MYKKKTLAVFVAVLLILCALTGCGQQKDGAGTKVVLTTGFEEDEIFRIGTSSCSKAEIMLYLTNMQNQYEQIYGQKIWEKKIGDMTVEEKIKNVVLARLAQIKTMKLLSDKQGVSLSKEERATVSQAAQAYYDSLTDTEIALLDITQEDIERLYEEYAVANKVYDLIIQDTNPEISDDEARTVTVSQIFVKTVTTGPDGQQEEMTQASQKAAYEKIRSVKKLLSDGEDFDTLAARYNEAGQITISFGKGMMDRVYEEAAFNLGKDEISDIVQTPSGYVIIKCVSTFDKEQTQLNKEKILEKRKEEAFSQIYDEFTRTQIRNLNDKLWESVTFIHDPQVKTSTFFEVYDQYFLQE